MLRHGVAQKTVYEWVDRLKDGKATFDTEERTAEI